MCINGENNFWQYEKKLLKIAEITVKLLVTVKTCSQESLMDTFFTIYRKLVITDLLYNFLEKQPWMNYLQ